MCVCVSLPLTLCSLSVCPLSQLACCADFVEGDFRVGVCVCVCLPLTLCSLSVCPLCQLACCADFVEGYFCVCVCVCVPAFDIVLT